jgi:hypothetical protein
VSGGCGAGGTLVGASAGRRRLLASVRAQRGAARLQHPRDLGAARDRAHQRRSSAEGGRDSQPRLGA